MTTDRKDIRLIALDLDGTLLVADVELREVDELVDERRAVLRLVPADAAHDDGKDASVHHVLRMLDAPRPLATRNEVPEPRIADLTGIPPALIVRRDRRCR